MASDRVRRIRRFVAATVTCTAMATIATAVSGGPATAEPPCAATISTLIPSPSPTGWAENITYDATGGLWVTRTLDNTVQRYDRNNRLTATVPVASPGAIRPGPGGALYVTSGDSPVNMIPGTPRTGALLRIDPAAARPVARPVIRGLGMPNGLAFDARGNAYIADGALGVIRLRPDGSVDRRWSRSAPQNLTPTATVNGTGVNGAVVVGDTLYVTLTTSLTGRVLAVPLDHPDRVRVAADLTAPLPGVLDDLTVLDSGSSRSLVVTSTLGQLHVVDLRTGTRCGVMLGAPLTAVAVRPKGPRQVAVTSENGAVYAVTLRR